ncbi:unnamed protein product [Periconia digitata]|uniref:Uncharacterized protein n=1 Tax=Periconia digitata TaxID=1303443 RepID=A0A9W4U642_9PLEO|nr:unnamed protein product [Periconia digitata]
MKRRFGLGSSVIRFAMDSRRFGGLGDSGLRSPRQDMEELADSG